MNMIRSLKILVVTTFVLMGLPACFRTNPQTYSVASDKTYEASIFRQNCAICHGSEGDGQTLENGTKVPSLRHGEFKFHTEDEIYGQIANGGNGMTPFKGQLTERELRMMAGFVHERLRGR
jgi:mono/diheme cytochrome c family protein